MALVRAGARFGIGTLVERTDESAGHQQVSRDTPIHSGGYSFRTLTCTPILQVKRIARRRDDDEARYLAFTALTTETQCQRRYPTLAEARQIIAAAWNLEQ